jgi:WG containing repeat
MGRLSRTWWQWLSIWGATVLIVLSLAGVALPRSSLTQDYRWVKNSPWVGYSFSDGLARVSLPDPLKRTVKNAGSQDDDVKLYGFINHQGKLVIAPHFFGAKDFAEGLAPVQTNYVQSYQQLVWGFIGKSGKVEIAPRFREVDSFSNGLAAVRENDKWGYINRQGAYVIPPSFGKANSFKEGIACTINYIDSTNSEHVEVQYIDRQGKVIKQLVVDTTGTSDKPCTQSSEGLISIPVKTTNNNGKNYRYGYMNHQGQIVISPKYLEAGNFSEGLAGVVLWSGVSNEIPEGGYINKKGQLTIPLNNDWSKPEEFHEGLASVLVRVPWGSANPNSSPTVPTSNSAYSFQRDRNSGVESKLLNKPTSSRIARSKMFQEDCGYINHKGVFVIKHTLDSCTDFHEGWAVVSDESYYHPEPRIFIGHINKKGRLLHSIQVEYFSREPFKEGLALFTKNGLNGETYRYMNRQGRTIISSLRLN